MKEMKKLVKERRAYLGIKSLRKIAIAAKIVNIFLIVTWTISLLFFKMEITTKFQHGYLSWICMVVLVAAFLLAWGLPFTKLIKKNYIKETAGRDFRKQYYAYRLEVVSDLEIQYWFFMAICLITGIMFYAIHI